MKKMMIMLLLTALCMTFLTSCDLGNGLVAELWGDIKDAGVDVDTYPTDDYIAIGTDVVIDIDPPVEDIMTTPPYVVEIETEEYTGPYTTDEVWWTYEECMTEPVPDAQIGFTFRTVECQYGENLKEIPVDEYMFGGELYLPYDAISFSFVGTAVLYAGECTVGYRMENACVLDDSFWGVGTDSIPEYREFRIEIPAELLLDGHNEVTLIYEMDREIYEIGTIVVFKEVPTTEVETVVPAGQDSTDMPEIEIDTEIETEIAIQTEIDTEIECPEIGLEG